MKKVVLIIALVLLMIAPVFAEQTSKDNRTVTPVEKSDVGKEAAKRESEVKLDVEMKPSYQYTVTAAALDASSAKDWNGNGVDAVYMERDGSTENIKQKADETYFVSYKFYEYEKVSLQITTSGNLQNSAVTKTIPYQVTVKTADANTMDYAKDSDGNYLNKTNATAKVVSFTEATLLSSDYEGDDGTKTILTVSSATDVLGDYAWGSLTLEVGNAESDCLKGMPKKTYTSNIVLKVISG